MVLGEIVGDPQQAGGLVTAAALPARWLAHATEQRSRLRPLLFARLLPPAR